MSYEGGVIITEDDMNFAKLVLKLCLGVFTGLLIFLPQFCIFALFPILLVMPMLTSKVGDVRKQSREGDGINVGDSSCGECDGGGCDGGG